MTLRVESYTLDQLAEVLIRLQGLGLKTVRIQVLAEEKEYRIDDYLEILREAYELTYE